MVLIDAEDQWRQIDYRCNGFYISSRVGSCLYGNFCRDSIQHIEAEKHSRYFAANIFKDIVTCLTSCSHSLDIAAAVTLVEHKRNKMDINQCIDRNIQHGEIDRRILSNASTSTVCNVTDWYVDKARSHRVFEITHQSLEG